MTFLSYFKKTLLVLLSLGLISTANSMEEEQGYFIATSANQKAFEQISDFKFVTDNSRDAIESIIDSKSQHVIFMIKTQPGKFLNATLGIFNNFIMQLKEDPTKIFKNFLYSGGITIDDEDHDLLVVAPRVKLYHSDSIKNVYAPKGRGYSVEFDQARVFYEITNPNQLEEFWHTEPAAMEQFLAWKSIENRPKNVIFVSKKPMCKYCSAFLLHSFCIESKGDVNFIVLSLSTLWELSNYDMLSKKKGEKPQEGFFDLINLLSKSKILDIVKEDLKCVSSDGNTLAMYGF